MPPSFPAVVLHNADILGLLASFLCFRGPCAGDQWGLDNSLLALAACSRRTQGLLMQAGRWWKQQHLVVELKQPLVSIDAWNRLTAKGDTSAVMVAHFGARQQAIIRRLLGAEVCEREVAPALNEVRRVLRDRQWGRVKVYPQLTHAFFDSLTEQLPKPCLRYIPDVSQCSHSRLRMACWDVVLLPACSQWMERVTIYVDTAHSLSQSHQTVCLMYTLSRLPGITRLSLLCDRWLYQYYAPAADLTDLLPSLTSLHIRRLRVDDCTFDALMWSTTLLQLQLDNILPYNPAFSAEWESDDDGMCFSYPQQWPATPPLSGQRVDEAAARRANRELRLALCASIRGVVSGWRGKSGQAWRWKDTFAVCEDVLERLQAEASTAAETEGGRDSGADEDSTDEQDEGKAASGGERAVEKAREAAGGL